MTPEEAAKTLPPLTPEQVQRVAALLLLAQGARVPEAQRCPDRPTSS